MHGGRYVHLCGHPRVVAKVLNMSNLFPKTQRLNMKYARKNEHVKSMEKPWKKQNHVKKHQTKFLQSLALPNLLKLRGNAGAAKSFCCHRCHCELEVSARGLNQKRTAQESTSSPKLIEPGRVGGANSGYRSIHIPCKFPERKKLRKPAQH